MKNVILLTILFTFYYCTIQSLAPGLNSNMLDFVKLSDSQELIKILNLIEEEHTKLKSNKDNHLLMCEKSLYNCKIKFSNKMCDVHNEFEKKGLDENLQENIKNNKESEDMLKQVDLLVRQNEEDCRNIETLFNSNEKKFDHDIKLVGTLLEGIRTNITILREEEEERIKKEKQEQEQRLKEEREKIEQTLNRQKKLEAEIDKKKAQVEEKIKELKGKINQSKSTSNQQVNAKKPDNNSKKTYGQNQTSTVTKKINHTSEKNHTSEHINSNKTKTVPSQVKSKIEQNTNKTKTVHSQVISKIEQNTNKTKKEKSSNKTKKRKTSNKTKKEKSSNHTKTEIKKLHNKTGYEGKHSNTTQVLHHNKTNVKSNNKAGAISLINTTNHEHNKTNVKSNNKTGAISNEGKHNNTIHQNSNATHLKSSNKTVVSTKKKSSKNKTNNEKSFLKIKIGKNNTIKVKVKNENTGKETNNKLVMKGSKDKSNKTEGLKLSLKIKTKSSSNKTLNTNKTKNNKTSSQSKIKANHTAKNNSKSSKANLTKQAKKLNVFFLEKIKRLQQEQQQLLELESRNQEAEQPAESNGFFSNLFTHFAQITQGFSLVQLSSGLSLETEFAKEAFNKVDKKLKSINNLKEKVEYLLVTQKELKSIYGDLKQSKVQLYDAFKESKSSCNKRLDEWSEKKTELRKSYLASKLEIETLKKKIILYDSNKDLCGLSKDNLKICNDLSDYCNSYQVEYSEELKELEDLMLYFKKYIDKL